MRLDPLKFNQVLNDLGQSFRLQRSAACPCMDPSIGTPKPNCKQCKGIGWIYGAMLTGNSGIASQKIQREWALFGLWQSGDMVLTIPSDSPLYEMGPYDKVVMLNSTEPVSLVRKRGIDDLQVVPWVQIERVFWLTGANQTLVEGSLPHVGLDGSLTWSGTVPPAGTQYSITGRRHPAYFMFHDLMQDRSHHHGQALPRRVVLRKIDLLGRQTS